MTELDEGALLRRLVQAAQGGEVVRIVYYGGSQPGLARDVVPLSVQGHMLIARDIAAGEEKHFRTDKIRLDESQHPAPGYVVGGGLPINSTRTIGDVLATHVAGLQALGWHVDISMNRISVHRLKKNGRPYVGGEVVLAFEGLHEAALAQTPPRPYYVGVSSESRGHRYAYLDHALAAFLAEAQRVAALRLNTS